MRGDCPVENISCQLIKKLLVFVGFFTCLLVAIHPGDCLAMGGKPVPTVTVIDEETGKPIEGAVAIAIWRKRSLLEGSLIEGGLDVVTKIDEAISDSEGNIYISGFWNWHLFGYDPHLNIYKPGYVCWDQNVVYIDELHSSKQTDFDNGHRIAHMKKWPEGFSFVGHDTFMSAVTRNDYTDAPKQLFNKAFQYEIPYRVKERDEIYKKRKEMELEKKRREMQ
jgi:hypothetical protein